MARPTPNISSLVNGQEAWDATLRDLPASILSNPLPLARYADFASLPDATQYEDCLAVTADHKAWLSDGTIWKQLAFPS